MDVYYLLLQVRKCNILDAGHDSALMADDNYVGVRLPRELIDEVDRLIDRKAMGFRSRAEFIADSIRRRLEQVLAVEKASRKGK